MHKVALGVVWAVEHTIADQAFAFRRSPVNAGNDCIAPLFGP